MVKAGACSAGAKKLSGAQVDNLPTRWTTWPPGGQPGHQVQNLDSNKVFSFNQEYVVLKTGHEGMPNFGFSVTVVHRESFFFMGC